MKRSKALKTTLYLVLIVLIGLGTAYFIPSARLVIEQSLSAVVYDNQDVDTRQETDAILATFPTVKQEALPETFLKTAGITTSKFKRLSPKTYFVLRKKDLYRKIAGHIRIVDLFARDRATLALHWWSDEELYWGINPAILHKITDLRAALREGGWNENGFHINYGYRHPELNEAVGGAPVSRHISGDALDIVIDDINNDGRANTADKTIVLNLCEKSLIASRGGIGRYPGTQVVHIDLRGKRARWDSY